MSIGYEFSREVEDLVNENVLSQRHLAYKIRFRPFGGLHRETNKAFDVMQQTRTRKKIIKAINVLQDEYDVPSELIREALTYTNTWNDALQYLALQKSRDELPPKLRATPIMTDRDTAQIGGRDTGSLDVVRAEFVSEPAPDKQPIWDVSGPMDSWDDEEDTPDVAHVESSEVNKDLAPTTPIEPAVSWTQQYLLKLAQQEEEEIQRKKEEAALTPKQRRIQELEMMLTDQLERQRTGKESGKLTKKKQKVLSQEISTTRMQLLQLGWQEAAYYQQQQTETLPVRDRVFWERDGRQSRTGFREDEDESLERKYIPVENEDEEENYGGGLFDQPVVSSKTAPTPSPPVIQAQENIAGSVLSDFSLSTSWTGKTPRDLLQDWCVKNKCQRPKYKKPAGNASGRNGPHCYTVLLEPRGSSSILSEKREFQAPAELFTISHGFRSIEEAKDTVATIALYSFLSHLPLYGSMPPPYRALWLSWEKEKEEALRASTDTEKQAFDSFVNTLLNDVPDELKHLSPPVATEIVPTTEPSVPVANVTLDNWDVDDWESEANLATTDVESEQPIEEVPTFSIDSSELIEESHALRRIFERNANTKQAQLLLPRRNELPIAQFKHTILETLANHHVMLISGETGCGKSTQVPQFILQEMLSTQVAGAHCNIICTQPRRLASISLAERVSHELGEEQVGTHSNSLCGYQIRLENQMTNRTKLLFCTTGILLRKLQTPSTLEQEVSHIIVDEVHERDVQSDVLLSLLRTFLQTQQTLPHRRHRPLKVILMSATLNAASFQQYFGGETKCPMLQVPGRTFPVQEWYLEDAIELTKYMVDEDSPCYRHMGNGQVESAKISISGRGGSSHTHHVTWNTQDLTTKRIGDRMEDQYSEQTWKTLSRLDESIINYELIEQVLERLVENPILDSPTCSASILIFLPGLQEISTLLDLLHGHRTFQDATRFALLPLHSSLSSEDQCRIFTLTSGIIRIIATTNIAETSLTIEDVKVVIDTGRAKEMHHNGLTRTNLLEEIWISRANAKQRLGRAGRTSGGVCYRMYSRSTYRHIMATQPVPEIKRAPLTSLCLQIKTFGIKQSCAEFLVGCLDSPDQTSVEDALTELFEIGALTRVDTSDEKLTTLGTYLAQLPVDVKVGKLLLLGAIFDEFDVISTCAAILETKSPFVAPYGFQKEMQVARQKFVIAQSDLLTDVNAFDTWRIQFLVPTKTNAIRATEKAFCRQSFLSRRSMMEMLKLKQQFRGIITQLGFLRTNKNEKIEPLTRERCAFISALVFAGLEPNVMSIDPTSHRLGLRDQDKTTVYIHPGSVNAKTKATTLCSTFMTYNVKLHTSQIYLPSCSIVMPSALCLFSFRFELVFPTSPPHNGTITMRLNEWIVLQSSIRSAVLLQELRDIVQTFIKHQIETPPFLNQNKSIKEDYKGMMDVLSMLFQSEYEACDPHHVLTTQLYPHK